MLDKKTIQEFKDLFVEVKGFTKSLFNEFKGNLKYWVGRFATSYDLDKNLDKQYKYYVVIK